ncbi:MAG: NAD(P)-dependent oxidoreductase [Patescibacteria group bacterium]
MSDKSLANKKVLVLGGSGFLGAHLVKELATHKAAVTVLCRNPNDIKKIPAFHDTHLVQGDITVPENVAEHVSGKDIIVNLATVVYNTGVFEPYTDLNVNCKGQINVLEARKNFNPDAQYIYIGSSMQFGRVPEHDLPIAEDYCQHPISLYGTHKAAAESYGTIYRRAHSLPSVVVRLPPLYGPSLTGKETRSIIEKFIKKALRKEPFNVNGFGKDLKDFLYADDVVDVIVRVMRSSVRDGAYHAGSGTGIQFSDVARMIVEECASGRFNLVPFPKELEPFEVGSFYFDITKAQRELGWEPKIDIREGIQRMVAFHRKEMHM